MQNGYRDVVHRGHWVDGNCPFYDAIAANHSKMDLSIRGHRGFKDASPINVPTGEPRACITCDGEEKCHGILADFEIATVLPSSRVAFCFSFRHSWKHRAQISKRPTVINPQSQTQ